MERFLVRCTSLIHDDINIGEAKVSADNNDGREITSVPLGNDVAGQRVLKPKVTYCRRYNSNNNISYNNISSSNISSRNISSNSSSLASSSSEHVKKPKRKSTSKAKPLVQLFLDVGQKNFDTETCSLCKMVYSRGQSQDESLHARFHARYVSVHVDGIYFPGWHDEEVVAYFTSDTSGYGGASISNPTSMKRKRIRQTTLHGGFVSDDDDDVAVDECNKTLVVHERIVVVRGKPIPSHASKVAEVRRLIDEELTFSGDNMEETGIRIEEQMYIYVSKSKRVIGCMVVHVGNIKANRILKTEADSVAEDTVYVDFNAETSDVSIGVSQMWVHSNYRRLGIATRLLDTVRKHAIFECLVPLDQISFSQPTPSGFRFAAHYTETDRFFVYSL